MKQLESAVSACQKGTCVYNYCNNIGGGVSSPFNTSLYIPHPITCAYNLVILMHPIIYLVKREECIIRAMSTQWSLMTVLFSVKVALDERNSGIQSTVNFYKVNYHN